MSVRNFQHPVQRDSIVDCANPLALSDRDNPQSSRGLPHSETWRRMHGIRKPGRHGNLAWLLALIGLAMAGFCPSAWAAPESDLTQAEQEGRALAAELISQQPTEHFVQTGLLTIRKGRGNTVETPMRFETTVGEASWQTTYEVLPGPATTNGSKLTIVRHPNSPNEYLLADGEVSTPRKLDRSQLMSPFADSDFWIADLGLEFFYWPQQKILKKEMRRSRFCKVLESVNPAPTPGGYKRVVCWIDSKSGGIVLAEAYDERNKVFKEFSPKEFEKVQGRYELREMRIRNFKTGTQTTIEFNLDKDSPSPATGGE